MFAKTIILAVVAIIYTVGEVHPTPVDIKGDNAKIVGGETVTNRSEYPYQVSLRYLGSHFCGGAIIDERHVVTAAHCTIINGATITGNEVTIVAGDLNLFVTSENTVTKTLGKVFVHEDFSFDTYLYDIAVLEIEGTFNFTSEVNTIDLATTTPAEGTLCEVSGWGALNESIQVVSSNLQVVTVPLVYPQACNVSYEGLITEGMICAGVQEGGKDACNGDSGGPLECNSILAGVVSAGIGCARPQYPGIYTNIADYRSWILEQISDIANTNKIIDYAN